MSINRAPAQLRTLVSGLAIAVAVTACSAGTPPASTATSGSTESADDLLPEIAAAKAEAEALGLRFATSREEIMAGAESEGSLSAIVNVSFGEEGQLGGNFEEVYPFLDVELLTRPGPEAQEAFLLEWNAGAVQDLGVHEASADNYQTFAEMCDWDIYGMAEVGILDIPLTQIDPNYRTVVTAGSSAAIFAYNRDSFVDRPLPETWDDLLNPEIYSREAGFRMALDTRLQNFASIVPEWGLERAKEYYASLVELGGTPIGRFGPAVIQMAQGEFDAIPFTALHSVAGERMEQHPNLAWKVIDPAPIRLSESHCALQAPVNNTPYASLLFLEWTASEGGQAALEGGDQLHKSHWSGDYPDGLGEILQGHEVSVPDYEQAAEVPSWISEIFEAAGFPQVTD